MLFRKFKQILIKIGEFFKLLKNQAKVPVGSLTKIYQKWVGENSSFLQFSLMHTHVHKV